MSADRSKYELEGAARVEELEEARKKLIVKLQEAEEQLEAQTAKAANMEKIKNRMQGDLEDVTIELERVSYYSKWRHALICSIHVCFNIRRDSNLTWKDFMLIILKNHCHKNHADHQPLGPIKSKKEN